MYFSVKQKLETGDCSYTGVNQWSSISADAAWDQNLAHTFYINTLYLSDLKAKIFKSDQIY